MVQHPPYTQWVKTQNFPTKICTYGNFYLGIIAILSYCFVRKYFIFGSIYRALVLQVGPNPQENQSQVHPKIILENHLMNQIVHHRLRKKLIPELDPTHFQIKVRWKTTTTRHHSKNLKSLIIIVSTIFIIYRNPGIIIMVLVEEPQTWVPLV